MSKTTQIILWIVIAIIVIGGIWYGVSKKPTNPTARGPIKIGFVGPLTGDAASYGIPIKNAITLAVEEINNAGGVNGRKIEMIYEDGKCTGKDAVNAAQKLINIDKVNIILGGMCSGELLSIAPITEPAKVLLLSPAASSPDITHAGDFIFRNNPSDADGGKALAKLIREKYTKAAIISENTDYAQALARVFVENFRSLGGEVVAQENFDPGIKDFRTILTKIKASNPQVLLINPQTEIAGGLIVKQAREMGITLPFYGTIALAGTKAIETAGKYAEGMLVVDAPGLSESNPKAVKFLADYKAKYGTTTLEFYLGAAYDAVYILADGISKYGTDTEKLKNYLYSLKNYNGVIGTYGFDENGDLIGIEYTVKQIKNGKAVELK
jgi:branched-chain amino acid transport system substrate-binding protein